MIYKGNRCLTPIFRVKPICNDVMLYPPFLLRATTNSKLVDAMLVYGNILLR